MRLADRACGVWASLAASGLFAIDGSGRSGCRQRVQIALLQACKVQPQQSKHSPALFHSALVLSKTSPQLCNPVHISASHIPMALTLFNDPFFTEMDRALGRAFPPLFAGIPSAATAMTLANTHPMDVVEHPDRYAITADAPGMGPEDIKIEVHDGKLRLSGEKKAHTEKKSDKDGVRFHVQERTWNKFSRTFNLPENARMDGISARMEHGVLTVDIPKMEVAKTEPVRIPVQAVSTGAANSVPASNGKA